MTFSFNYAFNAKGLVPSVRPVSRCGNVFPRIGEMDNEYNTIVAIGTNGSLESNT